MGRTSVDPQALRLAAQRLDAAADLLDAAVRVHLAGQRFRAAAVDQLAADVTTWQRSAREGAVGLRAVAERVIYQDQCGAEALG